MTLAITTAVLMGAGIAGLAVTFGTTDYNTGRGPRWAEYVGAVGVACLAHALLGGVLASISGLYGYALAGYAGVGIVGGGVAVYGAVIEWMGSDPDDGDAPWITGGGSALVLGIALAWVMA